MQLAVCAKESVTANVSRLAPDDVYAIFEFSWQEKKKVYRNWFVNLETRVKEHIINIKNGEIEKSAVVAHVWKEKLTMDHKPVLLKQASNKQELTNRKNTIITNSKDCVINFEILPADHLTKKFNLNPVEDSRLAPTNSNQNQSVMGWQWGQGPWKRFPYIQVSDVLCYK